MPCGNLRYSFRESDKLQWSNLELHPPCCCVDFGTALELHKRTFCFRVNKCTGNALVLSLETFAFYAAQCACEAFDLAVPWRYFGAQALSAFSIT